MYKDKANIPKAEAFVPKSLPLAGEGVRRGSKLAQCTGDHSRLTDEVYPK